MSRRHGFDVVIVGGGAAGCLLARRLADRGDRSVLLLEAGPDPRPDPASELHDGWRLPAIPDWGFRSEPVPGAASGPLRRGRVLGGTSWLTRFAVRGSLSDFDDWAAAEDAGWSASDVLSAFRAIEADAEFGDRPWHGAAGPVPITRYPELVRSPIHAAIVEAFERAGDAPVEDHNAPGAIGAGRIPMSSRSGRRVSALDAFLPTDVALPSLTVRPDALVDRVLVHAGRVTGVRLAGGEEVDAPSVVLSGGTYGSPSVLLRSGIGPAEALRALGIAVVVDLPGVGANLADHPAVEIETGWRGEGRVEPILQSIVTARTGVAPASDGPDVMFWISDPTIADPSVYADAVLLRPRSRGSVRLRSADPSDPPRIELPGLREPVDVERLSEALAHGLAALDDPAVRALCADAATPHAGSSAARREHVAASAYSLPHVVGTCAMGPTPGDGAVVDARGRVHGVDGLAVVDASIIPEPPSGFPHLITLMLAELLAGSIGER
jgi:choline dehydrogenase-like flavoprotein